jgi:hypothetical protein
MLLGVLGLGVPVVIHLIQKQRLKPQPLATIQFLDKEDVANAFAPAPRDLLQLLLRLLLMLLAVLLLTRLTLVSSTPGPRTMVIVLDQSMSMQQLADGKRSLFDVMKAQATTLLQGMNDGDRASLVLVGDRMTTTPFIDDRDELLRLLDEVSVGDTGGLGR